MATSEVQNTFATGRWAFQAMGILFGTATLVSLTKHSFAIELSGLPGILYKNYAWLRDLLFEPVARVLAYFGMWLQPWIKDVLMAYGLVAAAYSRAFRMRHSGLQLLRMSVLWPLYGIMLWTSIDSFRRMQKLIADASAKGGSVNPDAVDDLTPDMIEHILASCTNLLHSIIWNIVVIVICASGFFLWNYLQDVFGPK